MIEKIKKKKIKLIHTKLNVLKKVCERIDKI